MQGKIFFVINCGLIIICFIPQDRSLFNTLTVAENLAMAGYTINDKQDLRGRIDEALDTFPRLKERLTQYAGTMSGGEQQQLIFARAIILKPRVILIEIGRAHV